MPRPFQRPDADATATLDQRIRMCVELRRGANLRELLDQALETRTADAVLTEVLLPSMRSVVRRHVAGDIILPYLMESAEIVRDAVDYLGDAATFRKGTVLLATLSGDVHHIGRALLVSVLSVCGYAVHDLGSQAPVEAIVDAAQRLRPDAIGLSALLVTTSKQMPVCIQRLDERGVHVPVLIGGAGINRAFGRGTAVLPDGRLYDPGVFYCKDVFEGLAKLDALVDPPSRAELIAQTRADIEQHLSTAIPPPLRRPTPSGSTPSRDTPAGDNPSGGNIPLVEARHARTRPRRVVVPKAPYWGARRVRAKLQEVWPSLDRNTLFRYHWGGYRAPPQELERLVHDDFEPRLAALQADAEREGWLQPLIVNGYFAAQADGDGLIIYGTRDAPVARLHFPRQRDGEQLCLADYFRPITSGERDVVALQAVTAGPQAGQYIEELQRAGEYARMVYVSGLAAATAEALAEYAHQLARRDLSLGARQGLRFSWGYPACPDLAEQRIVLPLLDAEEQIGLRLSPSDNLDPEHSTAAIILHHPEAKYFAVHGVGA